MKTILRFVLLTAFLTACSHSEKNTLQSQTPQGPSVSLMTFNVENLFDTEHDKGKDDYTFLPLAKKNTAAHKKICDKIKVPRWKDDCLLKDWSEEILKEKLTRIAGTIKQVNAGQGPDILVMQEVENKKVLERLNKEFLNSAYAEVILIEGSDPRGIDVAIMSKLPLNRKPVLHTIPLKSDDPEAKKDTRGILEADLKLPDGSPLTVFAIHFPSPSHPADLRTQALAHLNSLATPLKASRYVIAAGDFNITAEENVSEKRSETLSNDWMVSHVVGCKTCKGTNYFPPKKSWSFLDWVIFSKNLESKDGWFLDTSSIQVLKGYGPQVDAEGYPARFKGGSEALGVSDHFPILTILRKAN